MPENKIVLAFSGGLDTSVAVSWLKEKYGAEIVPLTIDLGMVDLEAIRQRACRVVAERVRTPGVRRGARSAESEGRARHRSRSGMRGPPANRNIDRYHRCSFG